MWKRHWKLAVLVLVLAVQAVAIAVLWGQVDGLRADLADSREGAADLEARLEAADEALRELQAAQAQQGTDKLGNDRGECSTSNAELEYADKQKIEHDIDDR